jgi:type IX secretion system PorP/SprF family membrane protein
MKNILPFILLVILVYPVFSQQDPQFSQYMFNHAAINPGAAGSNEAICASALIHEQWMGFEGHPSTKVFNVNAPMFSDVFPSGLGLSIIQDNIGFEKNLGLNFAYAYRLKLASGNLGLGLGLGFQNKSLSNADWLVAGANSNPQDDPSIPQDASDLALDLSIGAFYKSNNFYAGLSTVHLNEPSISYDGKAAAFLKRHYYLTSGYNLPLPNPLLEFNPSFMFKYDGATTQMDINAMMLYNKKIWGGVSYRFEEAWVVLVGMELLNGIKFGLSYDFLTNDIGTQASGTLEVMLGYCFNVSSSKSKSGKQWLRNFGNSYNN